MRASLAVAVLLLAACAVAAEEMKTPQIFRLQADWEAANAALGNLDALKQISSPATADATKFDLLARLNRATGERFPTIAASPVPVLLPFDLTAFLRDKAAVASNEPAIDYLSGFHDSKFLLVGPAGYDAAFTVRPSEVAALSSVSFSGEVEIQISGMAFVYDLGEAAGAEQKPLSGALPDFPGLRRVYLESHMRYLFTRYGVLYAVSIECYDGPSRGKHLGCRSADPVAMHFLKALAVAGGMPQTASPLVAAQPVERPAQQSTIFAFHAPGQLISSTGARGRGGRSDYTVYSKIRFPLAEAPAHTYSQVFMNLGDCNQAGLDSRTIKRRGAPFRCPPSDKLAEVGASSGGYYVYPWRDNFCEARGFSVGQCPFGLGHQGEDIVPVDCKLSSQDTDHCAQRLHGVVAVHDGAVLRSPGQEGLVIVVNAPDEHLRFRYLHMNPKLIDAEGLLSGRTVREGEAIGKVGNYNGREAGTSYHLHFDMQAPTKDGWVLVNPYMTLVSAYERLIGGRGTEIQEEVKPAAVTTDAAATVAVVAPPSVRKLAYAAAPSRWKNRRIGHKQRLAAARAKKKIQVSKHCVRRRGC